ncbi:hypothetical protein CHS0354_000694 [Potamilus streckersoni]|uniref:Uncharacterized protein n=1 Tax=Potamilus streckersoni TaxID=2493646 RepID=A0AAE0T814_9BIVA|nr:hypothetical protein CHS0354_000694 [Potamilus streckersoni]
MSRIVFNQDHLSLCNAQAGTSVFGLFFVAIIGGIIAKPYGFNAKPNGIIAKPNGIIAKPNGIIAKPNGIIAKPNGIIAKPNGFNAKPNGFNAKPNGFNTKPNGFNTKPNGFNAKPNGFNAKPNGFNAKPNGFNTKLNDFGAFPCCLFHFSCNFAGLWQKGVQKINLLVLETHFFIHYLCSPTARTGFHTIRKRGRTIYLNHLGTL